LYLRGGALFTFPMKATIHVPPSNLNSLRNGVASRRPSDWQFGRNPLFSLALPGLGPAACRATTTDGAGGKKKKQRVLTGKERQLDNESVAAPIADMARRKVREPPCMPNHSPSPDPFIFSFCVICLKIHWDQGCCYGCGSKLQIEVPSGPGFVEAGKYQTKKQHRQLDKARVLQRLSF
jgi:hypothetical protein